ncbi:MAG: PfkB family carbohydrate kinase [Gemmataceae bacterium]
MSLLIVGTLAFDCIETPNGTADDVLGGSASFSSFAASYFTKPSLIAPIGEDFPSGFRQVFAGRDIDLTGVETYAGQKTFRWRGRYHQDMNTRDTLELHLNVLSNFEPKLHASHKASTHVFLANLSPAIQASVLNQVTKPALAVADTMDYWIDNAKADLLKLLPRLDGLLLNDSEARLLTGEDSLVRAGESVRKLGPKFVIVKKGEHGAMLFSEAGVSVLPAYPTREVRDPTGAGDTFAGGILGYLSTQSSFTPSALRRAMAYGTVFASLTVEDFGLDRLKGVTMSEVDDRLAHYKGMLVIE